MQHNTPGKKHTTQKNTRAEATLWSKRETARYLNIGVGILDRWLRDNAGPRAYKVGKQVRYRQEDVEKFLETCLRVKGGDGRAA
jgi:excisionase family DNA binding protein